MKKLNILFSILLMGFFVFEPFMNTSAQTAHIKTQPIYPRTMGTVTAGTNPVYSGINIVAKGMKVYLTGDTTGGVSSFTWTLTKPSGSTTVLSSTTTQNVNFVPDMVGQYIVGLTVGTTTDADTFFVSTYRGVTGAAPNCSQCHASTYATWQLTPHANVFKEGITGQLEVAPVNGQQMGVYSLDRCAKCHTTGWDQSANNGNFGYLAHQSGYDTTWAKTYTLQSGEYFIPQGDMTAWNLLTTNSQYSNAAPVSSISCESCHGPGDGHAAAFGDTKKISKTLDAGVCLVCHDAPTHHTIGTYFEASNHATMPLAGSHATSTSCFPCHSGSAYYKYSQSQTAPGYTSADGSQNITCAVCHDPHVATNFGLRLVPITLKNGYSVPSSIGGNGQLCMTCHQSRANINTYITTTAPYYGFGDRFGPHHAPQADMYLGQNAYQYGDSTLTGLMTHGSVPDACVTCHMANIGTGNSPSHQWSMIDTTGGTPHDLVGGCVSCHGPITSFDDIKASSDWDANGKIEGVQTEIEGMLNNLAALLPKDSTGAVVSMRIDSLKVKGQPNVIKGIFTYYFVESDQSMGVHNAKYTVAILQKALSALGQVVPVELTSLQAAYDNNAVSISWATATETNNKGFEVQKKYGNTWTTIGFVSGKGTSTAYSQYSFVDKLTELPSSPSLIYRLKQIDLNGTSQLSKEVEVSVATGPREYSLSQNYPNPFNPSTTIQYSLPYESNIKVVVYNVTGAVVKVLVNSVQNAGVHQFTFNTASSGIELSSGIYFYQLEATSIDGSKSFRETKKMILMK